MNRTLRRENSGAFARETRMSQTGLPLICGVFTRTTHMCAFPGCGKGPSEKDRHTKPYGITQIQAWHTAMQRHERILSAHATSAGVYIRQW